MTKSQALLPLAATLLCAVTPAQATVDANLSKAIANTAKMIVFFERPGCDYCTYLGPKFDALTKANKDIMCKRVHISGDTTGYKKEFGFSTFPTVVYFKDGIRTYAHGSDDKTVTQYSMQKQVKRIYG